MHGDFAALRPGWLPVPEDVNQLHTILWPSNVGRNSDGELTVFGGESESGRDAGVTVSDLAQEYDTPAYILDEDDFRERCRTWRAAFADADVYYASKAFCSKAVLRIAAEEGLRVDVCSGGELAVALAAGVEPDFIALHGNNKSVAELRQALTVGVGRVVVDSLVEIDRLAELAADLGVRARVMVRVNVGVEAHTHEYIATAHEDQKFGFSLSGGDAYQAAQKVMSKTSLTLLGLHSHIGSQIFETAAFEVSAARLVKLQTQLQTDFDVTLPELDLGGGFGMAYTSQDAPMNPAEISASFATIMRRECAEAGIEAPRLSIEPGRSLIGPSMFTLYRVGTVKPVTLSGGASRLYVSVDGGLSDNIRPALYDAPYSATVANRSSAARPVLARVVGKHCEAGDILVKDEFLPADVAPGDLLAVPGTGAYCRSMASNYNHVARPPVISVSNGASRPIVARETVDDLLRLDVG
nr:diaminopimelate decarboxylase [Natronoglycomyces albus]